MFVPQVVQTHLTALRPVQASGEVDTQPHAIDPVVDPQLPREQAGFRRGRSTMDQVTLLTQDIEDSFQHNEKAGVVFLDLTAAYDTAWHRGLHLKLLRIIPDSWMWRRKMLRNSALFPIQAMARPTLLHTNPTYAFILPGVLSDLSKEQFRLRYLHGSTIIKH